MAYERKWLRVEAQSFVANGGDDGSIILASTSGFKVKQKVKITAVGKPSILLEVKRVLSPTTLLVGPLSTGINTRTNLIEYTTDKFPAISAEEQEKNSITREDREAAIYEQEPTVAKRVVLVDEWGSFYQTANPLPVQLTDGSINISTLNAQLEVQLTHRDNYPKLGDEHDSVRLGDGDDLLEIIEDGDPKEKGIVAFSFKDKDDNVVLVKLADDGSIPINLKNTTVENPLIQQHLIVAAGIEYNLTLPIGTKQFELTNVKEGRLQVSYIAGQSGTVFKTIKPGNTYEVHNMNLTSPLIIYFQSPKNDQFVELVSWS
jgi:hypothetical protein